MPFGQSRLAFGACVALLVVARTAAADCVGEMRRPTPQEKQAYAEAFALFQRMAPPTPAGWVGSEDPPNTIEWVCVTTGETASNWSFNRSYERREGMAERQAAVDRRMDVAMAKADAIKKANQAKLDEIQRKMDAIQQKMEQAANAGRLTELEPLGKEFARLADEQSKLQGNEEFDAPAQTAGQEFSRDTHAGFNLTVGATELSTSGYTPYAVPAGKGFRRIDEPNGNPRATILVALPAKAGQRGQTFVRVTGDPSRADSLLKAARLQ